MVSEKLRLKAITSVIDVASTEFPIVDKNQTLVHAIRLMDKYGIDRVVVIDDKKLVGIMTKKDLLDKLMAERTRRVSASRLHVSSFMSMNPIVITPDLTVNEAARIMIEKNISSLPILMDDEVKALLTKHDLAKIYLDIDDLLVKEVMGPVAFIAQFGDRVIHVRQRFRDYDIEFAPVIDFEEKLVGTVSINEIADAYIEFHEIIDERHRKEKRQRLYVEDIMKRAPATVTPDTPVSEAVKEILNENTRGIVVVEEKEIVGVLTITDLTKTLALIP